MYRRLDGKRIKLTPNEVVGLKDQEKLDEQEIKEKLSDNLKKIRDARTSELRSEVLRMKEEGLI
jgi:hypothetical protein